MKTNTEIKGLVLSNQEYKDNDAIITVLCREGIRKVYARGVLKPTSKNRRICQPFSLVEYNIQERNNGFDLLMQGNLIAYYYTIQQDLFAQSICFVVRDCILHSHSNEWIYEYLLRCWQHFHQQSQRAVGYALLVLRECMKAEGISPYISGCIRCQRTDRIETISLQEGGFLCRGCNAGRYPAYQKEQIVQIHSLFHARNDQSEQLLDTYSFNVDDIEFWANWIQHHLSIRLDSLRFLQSIA